MKKTIYLFLILSIFLSATSSVLSFSKDLSSNGKINLIQPKNKKINIETTPEILNKNTYINYKTTNLFYSLKGNYSIDVILRIDQSGLVILETKSANALKNKVQKLQLTKNEFINLKSIMNNAKLFTMEDSYKCTKNSCTTSATSLEFHYYEKTKNITINTKDLPKDLNKVVSTLNSIKTRILYGK